jgi:hypothetical protein
MIYIYIYILNIPIKLVSTIIEVLVNGITMFQSISYEVVQLGLADLSISISVGMAKCSKSPPAWGRRTKAAEGISKLLPA